LKIAIVGLGKVGLPLAVFLAQKNIVIGIDIDEVVVGKVNNAIEPFPGEKGLKELLEIVVRNKNLSATSDIGNAVFLADVIISCIPLIIDDKKAPDFENYDNLVQEIGRYIKKDVLVSFETTLPVGTTRNRFTSILEKMSGYEVGKDFSVVFSPERISSGTFYHDLLTYPKLVGGVTDSCTVKGKKFYEVALTDSKSDGSSNQIQIIAMSNSETAEFTKIVETTYRDVNIGLANEFTLYANRKNIDFTEVVKAANTNPHTQMHSPGISVGGHCIPVDPIYLSEKARVLGAPSRMIELASNINDQMPNYFVGRAKEKLGSLKDKRILVVGVAYKPNVSDIRETPVEALLTGLTEQGAKVYWHDDLVKEWNGSKSVALSSDYDLAIIATPHSYIDIEKLGDILILDTRGSL
jgi:nucleotide sugar dehydrogenase